MQQEKNPVSYPHLSCIGLYRDYMGVTCNFTKNKPVPTKSLSCKTENKRQRNYIKMPDFINVIGPSNLNCTVLCNRKRRIDCNRITQYVTDLGQ